ncbi:SRPBCC family protein [Microbacterium sp. ZW T5_56]|uniref:SRPBCC family protein n=1 Tax=Microbacterium sp. ZW T5_56 TaxID=3378081 RepID=UPI003851FEC6
MSRLAATLAASQTLSMAGFAEAARHHRTVADLDDLLIALTVDDGLGGQALRAGGVQRDDLRTAIVATRAHRLAALGIAVVSPEPEDSSGRHMTRCEWSGRVLQLFQSVPVTHDFSATILRAVLDEPSGHVAEVLAHTTLDRAELERVLDAAGDTPPPRPIDTGVLSGSVGVHVAAPVEVVWDLLADPLRLHEWAPSVGESALSMDNGSWLATTPAAGPDGRPLRVRDGIRHQHWTLLGASMPTHVEWQVTYPDLPRANRQRLLLELAPSAGGARVDVTVQWHRTAPGRSGLGRILRPFTRWATRQGARSTAQAITNVFFSSSR